MVRETTFATASFGPAGDSDVLHEFFLISLADQAADSAGAPVTSISSRQL
jgi:hypothetical protein